MVAGKQLLSTATGLPVLLSGLNWGRWGFVQPGDGALVASWGVNAVRIPLRWDGLYDNDADSRLDGAPGHINPANLAIHDAMMDEAEAAGLWSIPFIDSDCGQSGLQTPEGQAYCDPLGVYPQGRNFWRDSGSQAKFFEAHAFLADRNKHRERIALWELLPEPNPREVSDADVRAFYSAAAAVVRATGIGAPLLVGASGGGQDGTSGYAINRCDTAFNAAEPDFVYTGNLFSATGSGSQDAILASLTSRLQKLIDMRDLRNVPVHVQQWGAEAVKDPQRVYQNATANLLTINGVPGTYWQMDDGVNPDGYGIFHTPPGGSRTVKAERLADLRTYWAGELLPPPPPPPPPVETWSGLRLLGLNTPLPVFYNPTRPWRNLVHQVRFTLDFNNDNVPLKQDGYPIAGTTFYAVFSTAGLSSQGGTYSFAVDGKHVPTYVSTGSAAISYNGATNRTTGVINGVVGTADLVLGFTNIGADFEDLQLYPPGYAIDDPERFVPAWISHAGRASVLRCMDLQKMNEEQSVAWVGSRAAGSDKVLQRPGSVLGCMEMVNALGTAPWLCISPVADADHIRQFLIAAFSQLQPGQILFLGNGNELFNTKPGFASYPASLRASVVASQQFNGNTSVVQAGRRIVSISRADNKVTIGLDGPHGWAAGQQVFQNVDTGFCAGGLETLVTGTAGTSLVFNDAGAPGSGTVRSWDLGSYVYLNPSANTLTVPLTTYGEVSAAGYPEPGHVKVHHELQFMRAIHEAAVELGVRDRLCIVRDTFVGYHPDETWGLARAVQQYGDLDWLDTNGGGLSTNFYMTPANANAMTTVDAVFTQLEASLAEITGYFGKAVNHMRRFGLAKGHAVPVYEAGQHIHEAPTQQIADAVQVANRDDSRMGTLLAKAWKALRDRGAGVVCFFTSGCSKNFGAVSPLNGSGNAWGLREGVLASSPAQVKDTWFGQQGEVSAVPEAVDGITWGTIYFRDVIEVNNVGTPDARLGGPDNELLIISPNYRTPDYWVQIYAPGGTHTIELAAGGWFFTGDTLGLEIDGNLVASGLVPQVNINTTKPGVMLSASVPLSAGWHWARVRLSPATRTLELGLRYLRCT